MIFALAELVITLGPGLTVLVLFALVLLVGTTVCIQIAINHHSGKRSVITDSSNGYYYSPLNEGRRHH
jgi:hypothetical protein